ncbi:hypothetical protein ACQ4PT_014150 [Festuca glaucescens]
MASGVATTPEFTYEPSPWIDFFAAYEPLPLQGSLEWITNRADELKEDIRVLLSTRKNTTERMFLLDTLQHLGIDCHFEEQINVVLRQILESEISNSNLHEVSLRFQLLREKGHWVSPDVFNKFRSEDGSFIRDIINDPKGLLSLYNATHLLVHGEKTLEEAMDFSRHHLKLMSGSLKFPLDKQVQRALCIPLPRTNKRVEMMHYILEYEQEDHTLILLELAKLDFNLQQHVHLKELKAITRWWKDFSGCIRLSFIRDRVVEGFTWASVLFYDTGFEFVRSIITKMIVLITTLDDIYDNHATLEDCRKLHEAIQRWDHSAVSILPKYLKKFYMEMLRTFQNIEVAMPININYDMAHLKRAVQNNVMGYLHEAEWSHQNHKPSFVDHVKLTSMNIGVPAICVSMMTCMNDQMMKPALEWAASVPDVIIAVGKISRFMNDIGAFERRKCKGDLPSTVERYISEHCVTSEVAIKRIDTLMEEEWRNLNQARFENHALLPALQQFISLAISTTFFYGNRNDVYTHSTNIGCTIESLFIKPI